MAGYELSLKDLQGLISNPAWQSSTAAFLAQWYGYSIIGERDEAVVLSTTGDPVDVARLHDQIQSDSRQQFDLYQRAMTLWR